MAVDVLRIYKTTTSVRFGRDYRGLSDILSLSIIIVYLLRIMII